MKQGFPIKGGMTTGTYHHLAVEVERADRCNCIKISRIVTLLIYPL